MTTQTATIFHTIQVPREIPEQDVRDLLTTAFECNEMTSAWACNLHYRLRKGLTIEDFAEGGSEAKKVERYHPSMQLIPFVEGCVVTIEDTEEEENGKPVEYELDRAAMVRGFDIMAEKYPQHFQDFINEDMDAITADVWLQCCVLGEVVYG